MAKSAKLVSILLILIGIGFLPSVAQAAAANCPHYQSGVDCVDDYLMGGKCIAKATAESWYDFCKALDPNKALNCAVSDKVCVCGPGYETNPNVPNACRAICPSGQLYCGAVCQVKNNGTCAAQGMSVADYCTGKCSDCAPGYVPYNNKCKLAISVIYDEGISTFLGNVNSNWLDLGQWKLVGGTGPDIYFTGNTGPGKVGIGTNVPKNKLDVAGGTAIGSGYAGVNLVPADSLIVQGNVGVGVPAPTKKLDVKGDVALDGDIYFNKANINNCKFPANALKTDNGLIKCDTYSDSDWKLDAFNVDMYSQNTGNVGIGTLSPGQKLDVWGLIRSNRANSIAASGLEFGTAGTSEWGMYLASNTNDLYFSDLNNSPYVRMTIKDVTGNVGVGTIGPTSKFSVAGNVAIGAVYAAGAPAAPANGLIVEGSVGIGTTNPDHKLNVVGNAKFDFGGTGTFAIGTPLGNGPGVVYMQNNAKRRDVYSWNGGLAMSAGTSSAPSLVESQTLALSEGTGNVGIGTWGPAEKLDVIGNILARGPNGFNGGGQTASVLVGDGNHKIISTYGGGIEVKSTEDIRLSAGGSVKMKITSGGNVGIGLSSDPTYKLEVNGDSKFYSGSNTIGIGSPLGNGPGFVLMQGGTGRRDIWSWINGINLSVGSNAEATNLAFDTSGQLGVGTWWPNAKLDVRGNGVFTGSLQSASFTTSGAINSGSLSTGSISGSSLTVSGNITATGNSTGPCSWSGWKDYNTTPYDCPNGTYAAGFNIGTDVAGGASISIHCCSL